MLHKPSPSLWDYLKAWLARRFPGRMPASWAWDEATWTDWEEQLTAQERLERATRFTAKPFPGPAVKLEAEAPMRTSALSLEAEGPARTRRQTYGLGVLALFLALAGQAALNPPRRAVAVGVLFYALALALWVHVRSRHPAREPLAPPVPVSRDPWVMRPVFLMVAALASAAAFVGFGNHLFTPRNLALWLMAVVGVFLAFWPSRPRLRWSFTMAFTLKPHHLALLLALVLAVFFRGYRLGQVPPEMFSDHAEKLYDVMDVLDGQWRVFFPRNTGREGMQMYLTALMARLFGTGISFMSLKLGTFVMGLFMLPYLYLLGRELSGPWTGVAAVLLAGMAYWPNVQARVALRFILYPAFVAPTLYHLVRGLRQGSPRDFLWAGLFLGLGLHGYSPFRIVPLVVLAGLFLAGVLSRRGPSRDRIVMGALLTGLTAFVAFLPLFRYMLDEPFIFFYRSATRIGQLERPYPEHPARIFVQESAQALVMPWWDNGPIWAHSVPGHPALATLSAALLALGGVAALMEALRARRWEPLFLLVSVYILMLPSILSLAFPEENPSLNRTAGAVVPVFLLAGWAGVTLLRDAWAWTAGRAWRKAVVMALVLLLVGVEAGENYHLVFRVYAENFRLSVWNTSELGAVIGGFARSVGRADQAWVVPYPHWVDTRLVGIQAGFPRKDYALPRERLAETLAVPSPKLFLFKPEDTATQQALLALYSQGRLWRYISPTPGKDFMVFFVP